MDLAVIKPITQKIEIMHPGTRAPTGFVIEVTSLDSPAVKAVKRRYLDKALKNRNRKPTPEELEDEITETYAAAIAGWEFLGDATWGGKKLDLTPENAALVLAQGWLRAQVKEALDDEAGFFQN